MIGGRLQEGGKLLADATAGQSQFQNQHPGLESAWSRQRGIKLTALKAQVSSFRYCASPLAAHQQALELAAE